MYVVEDILKTPTSEEDSWEEFSWQDLLFRSHR